MDGVVKHFIGGAALGFALPALVDYHMDFFVAVGISSFFGLAAWGLLP